MRVELTKRELEICDLIARQRLDSTPFFKGHENNSESKNTYAFLGACGEWAACSALDVFPRFASEIGADDASGLEFRTTPYETGSLIVYPADQDHLLAVLVIDKGEDVQSETRIFELRGWIRVADAKRMFPLEERRKGGVAYWVPQNALRPIEDLTF